jgi:hypothetical protein
MFCRLLEYTSKRNLKSAFFTFYRQFIHRYIRNMRKSRAFSDLRHKGIDIRGNPLRFEFDSAVRQVPHPAGEAVAQRPVAREIPEAHSLDPAFDNGAYAFHIFMPPQAYGRRRAPVVISGAKRNSV